MALSNPTQNNWYVSIPFSDLQKLAQDKEYLERLESENAQLRREMDGLRNMFNELLTEFGNLRRELKKG